MEASNRPRRATVGFRGGQTLPVRIPTDTVQALRVALEDGRGGWHELQAVDGAVLVDLEQVVYLRIESDEHKVGF